MKTKLFSGESKKKRRKKSSSSEQQQDDLPPTEEEATPSPPPSAASGSNSKRSSQRTRTTNTTTTTAIMDQPTAARASRSATSAARAEKAIELSEVTLERWKKLRGDLKLKTDNELAEFLLGLYEKGLKEERSEEGRGSDHPGSGLGIRSGDGQGSRNNVVADEIMEEEMDNKR